MNLEHGFRHDTKIRMQDGTSKEIQYIKVGDCVVGENNAINKVVYVGSESADNTPLCSINASDKFFTPTTKFKTLTGWHTLPNEKIKYLNKEILTTIKLYAKQNNKMDLYNAIEKKGV